MTAATADHLDAALGDPCRVVEQLVGVPFTEGNRVDVLRNGDETFPALLAAIRSATRSVDLLWFLWGKGEVTGQVAQALAERARAGVRVRLLLDGFGAKGIDRSQVGGLRSAGAQVVFYRPLSSWRVTTANLRTHRRVLVCDETTAFTGGTGVDRAWTGDGTCPDSWRDNAFRVTGPAVAGLRSAFVLAWLQTPHPLVTAADRFPVHDRAGDVAVQVLRPASQPGWNDAALAVLALLQVARERARIATPYARVPGRLRELLCATARRGVQVQLLVPGPHVDRPFVQLQAQRDYQQLLAAGIEIWHYQPSMLHAKVFTVDGRLAMVGTTNLDTRSLAVNEQVGLVLSDPATTAVLDEHYDQDLTVSRRVSEQQWRDRPVPRRLLEAVAKTSARPLRGLGSAGLTGPAPDRPRP